MISIVTFSQEKLIGKYCSIPLGESDVTCIDFKKNNQFDYVVSGCLGISSIGSGKYELKNNNLNLIFDKTEQTSKSKIQIAENETQSEKESNLKFNIVDENGFELPANVIRTSDRKHFFFDEPNRTFIVDKNSPKAKYYREALESGLKEYASSIGEKYSDQFYKDMAWAGLLDTEAWKKQYADAAYAEKEKKRIQKVIQDFISAAVRSEKAGFDGVEVHGAHGYLLTQFMSTELNQRSDEYGGSYENRTRIVREIIAGIKRECSEGFSVGIRLSPEGYGMPLTEVTRFCQELIDDGSLDYLDISLWDCSKESADEEFQGRSLLSYFTDLSWGDVKLVVAGKLKTPADAEAMMEQGVDFVMLGRAGILTHDFPNRYKVDPEFEATQLPVTAEHLESEGLSPAFIKYLSGWDGFVK